MLCWALTRIIQGRVCMALTLVLQHKISDQVWDVKLSPAIPGDLFATSLWHDCTHLHIHVVLNGCGISPASSGWKIGEHFPSVSLVTACKTISNMSAVAQCATLLVRPLHMLPTNTRALVLSTDTALRHLTSGHSDAVAITILYIYTYIHVCYCDHTSTIIMSDGGDVL